MIFWSVIFKNCPKADILSKNTELGQVTYNDLHLPEFGLFS